MVIFPPAVGRFGLYLRPWFTSRRIPPATIMVQCRASEKRNMPLGCRVPDLWADSRDLAGCKRQDWTTRERRSEAAAKTDGTLSTAVHTSCKVQSTRWQRNEHE